MSGGEGREHPKRPPRPTGAGRAGKAGIDVPILLMPVFVAVVALATARLGPAAMLACLAPALFYGAYALHLRRSAGASAREKRVLAAMRRRLRELAPEDAAASAALFQARLQQEISRSARHGLPLTVLALRLHRGRAQPQERAFVVLEVLGRSLRAEDSVCQLADSEYALCLPQTTPAGAAVVMERLDQALEAYAPRFGMAYLEPGRAARAAAMIDFARRSHVPRKDAAAPTAEAA